MSEMTCSQAQRLLDDPHQEHLRLHIIPVVLSNSLSASQGKYTLY